MIEVTLQGAFTPAGHNVDSRTWLARARLDFTFKLNFTTDVQMVYIFPSGTFASSVATASPKEGNQPQNNLPNQLDDPVFCQLTNTLTMSTQNSPPWLIRRHLAKTIGHFQGIWHSHSPKSSTTMQYQHSRRVQKHR